jgi:hypothetical protein
VARAEKPIEALLELGFRCGVAPSIRTSRPAPPAPPAGTSSVWSRLTAAAPHPLRASRLPPAGCLYLGVRLHASLGRVRSGLTGCCIRAVLFCKTALRDPPTLDGLLRLATASLSLDQRGPPRTACALLARLCGELMGANAGALPPSVGGWLGGPGGIEVALALLGGAARTGAADLVPRMVATLASSLAVAQRAGTLDAGRFRYARGCCLGGAAAAAAAAAAVRWARLWHPP